jgi:hypothetical protein
MTEWLSSIQTIFESFNEFFWITANLLIAYNAIVLVVFVVLYYVFFDPRATTAGRFVFRFMLSLIGVIGLVVIGIFLDPSHDRKWYEDPGDILWWRPFARFVVYGYVAYSVTALAALVVIRKWWPEKIHTSKTRELLKTRH